MWLEGIFTKILTKKKNLFKRQNEKFFFAILATRPKIGQKFIFFYKFINFYKINFSKKKNFFFLVRKVKLLIPLDSGGLIDPYGSFKSPE